MKNEIRSLQDAELTIRRAGIVNNSGHSETVEGIELLKVCGLSLSSYREELKRQVQKHAFVEGRDFMRRKDATHKKRGQKPYIYNFSINAANHILLAAMTKQGKQARQEAIDIKTAQQTQEKPVKANTEDLKICTDFIKTVLTALPNLGSKSKQSLIASTMNEFAGVNIIPAPRIEQKYFTATQLADEFGVSANLIGRIANKHDVKQEQFGEYRLGKARGHDKQVEQFYYNEAGRARLSLIVNNRAAA